MSLFTKVKSILFDEGLSAYIYRKTKKSELKGEQTALISFKNKSTKIVLNKKNGYVDRYIYKYGIFDREVAEEINKNLNPEAVFLDIGANIGQQSLINARFVKKFTLLNR